MIERVLLDIGQAGLSLVEAILNNTQGAADVALHDIDSAAQHWRQVLDLQATIQPMVTDDQLSRQYQMAAACETAAAHLGLAGCVDDANERAKHHRAALEASEMALNVYRQFGFTQVVECLGEEIMHRHSLALAANGRDDEARRDAGGRVQRDDAQARSDPNRQPLPPHLSGEHRAAPADCSSAPGD